VIGMHSKAALYQIWHRKRGYCWAQFSRHIVQQAGTKIEELGHTVGTENLGTDFEKFGSEIEEVARLRI
jgi:hypothetical protein